MIVCPLVFLAGFVDAIGGGGGLISLPGYLLAGLPPHMAVATNKLSSTCGTSVATIRFARRRMIDYKLALPTVILAVFGSFLGAHLSLLVDAAIMEKLLYIILPISAFFVLNKHIFHENKEPEELLTPRVVIVSSLAAFLIGIYDGFYGPGTGTFLIIALTVFAKLPIAKANGQTKAINLTTNVTSLVVFLTSGQVVLALGVAAAVCNIAGNYLGASLALSKGAAVVKPITLLVLFLLLLKVLGIY